MLHLGNWRALKKLVLLEATPQATPTLVSCSPNSHAKTMNQLLGNYASFLKK